MKNNKLIAEFMGLQKTDVGWYDNDMMLSQYVYDQQNGNCFDEHELAFHTSWDWLILVIKKINEQISPNVRGLWRMITHPYKYHIEDVFNQVVEFINEYNK